MAALSPIRGPDSWPALDPWREHDACGVGFVARSSAERSNDVLQLAVEALARLAHRGAASTDSSGDGAGLLTQIPRKLLQAEATRLGLPLAPGEPFAIGALFLPAESSAGARAAALVEEVLARDGLPFLGWREVPVDLAALGPTARASCPAIRHAFVGRPKGPVDEDGWERALYLARREIEIRAGTEGIVGLHVVSLSCRTVVYKALLTGRQLPAFFVDFHASDYETAVAVFHSRFSTNTLPAWALAQPFHLLAHNGEINTLWGNRNAMAMRRPILDSPLFGAPGDRLRDVIWQEGSDSASLDNAMELLVRSGRDPLEAAMMLMPQAWEKYPDVDPAVKAFYEYQQCLLEPWDGPAALAFTDGVLVGAAVDRNGLRPCRFKVRRDGLVVAGSEVGVVDLDPRDVVESGGVGPGEVLLVDLKRKIVVRNRPAKREVATRKPYADWVSRRMITLAPAPGVLAPLAVDERLRRQIAAGWTGEDVTLVLAPMGTTGADAVWSMGDDTPIPPLALVPRPLYAYFRQRFAQVTNPPIDSLREAMVMSLRMHLGRRGSPLVEEAASAEMLRIEHPVLLGDEMAGLRAQERFSTVTLDAVWPGHDLPSALVALAERAATLVREGTRILILSDRAAGADRPAIPMPLALGAVRQHLVREGLRAQTGLVVEAADAFDVHHLAVLFGYGAEAVHPWLALETVGDGEPARSYRAVAEKGLLKVLSKMGISTLSSYCGAQIFEVLGLAEEVLESCFSGTASPVLGIGFAEIEEDVRAWHRAAYGDTRGLPEPGRVKYRRDGEDHAWAPPVVQALQKAAREATPEAFHAFEDKAETHPARTPRDLMTIVPAGPPVPVDEVEPAAGLLGRFISSAMSLGALSPEAHETLTEGMNRLGAFSNSGEGGEDRTRAGNRIKQVASARFGVTADYLVRAEELEIKIVQGAKPGEGGQLPAHKVTSLIARLRHSVPGVALLSPPPHHDIYSIEDLAQLVTDLKTVNPRARVGVKLVSSTGVGTIAAGVTKAYADYVLIAGHSGGTGASPLSSIKHTGLPWEIGLAEAQRHLVEQGLRHRIEIRTDGGLMSARDVVVAALLGAEKFGFGTAALVSLGCVMARQCHMNTCPTGIATQKEELRARFKGTPEKVMSFFLGIAGEIRLLLAALGARSLQEIVGRSDLLRRVERPDAPRAHLVDLGGILRPFAAGPRHRTVARNDRPGLFPLDREILQDLESCLDERIPFSGSYSIRSHHLSVGARVAGAIAERHGDQGLPRGQVRLRFAGSAGQSFGAFAVKGMQLDLEGEANDYVGKGLSGGEITIRPFRQAAYAAQSHENQILGNAALYGATGGRLFAAGQAGIRFAVRNSGALAVIEGAGNHACEYMTGGVVVSLGRVGRNFGAGMSNGVAYVLDEDETVAARINEEMAEIAGMTDDDERLLLVLVKEHQRRTASPRAGEILSRWDWYLPLIRKVVPRGEGAHARAEEIRASWLLAAVG